MRKRIGEMFGAPGPCLEINGRLRSRNGVLNPGAPRMRGRTCTSLEVRAGREKKLGLVADDSAVGTVRMVPPTWRLPFHGAFRRR